MVLCPGRELAGNRHHRQCNQCSADDLHHILLSVKRGLGSPPGYICRVSPPGRGRRPRCDELVLSLCPPCDPDAAGAPAPVPMLHSASPFSPEMRMVAFTAELATAPKPSVATRAVSPRRSSIVPRRSRSFVPARTTRL